MDRERSSNDLLDRLSRIERRVRVLEDHLHLTTKRAKASRRRPRDVAAVEPDRAAGGIEEAQHETGRRRLPAARLADDTQRLTASDGQTHVFHGMDSALCSREHAVLHGEVLRDVPKLHDCVGRVAQLAAPSAQGSRIGPMGALHVCGQVAAIEVAVRDRAELGELDGARRKRVRAAWVKRAASGDVEKGRRRALDREHGLEPVVDASASTGSNPQVYGCCGAANTSRAGPVLHRPARVHHERRFPPCPRRRRGRG